MTDVHSVSYVNSFTDTVAVRTVSTYTYLNYSTVRTVMRGGYTFEAVNELCLPLFKWMTPLITGIYGSSRNHY